MMANNRKPPTTTPGADDVSNPDSTEWSKSFPLMRLYYNPQTDVPAATPEMVNPLLPLFSMANQMRRIEDRLISIENRMIIMEHNVIMLQQQINERNN